MYENIGIYIPDMWPDISITWLSKLEMETVEIELWRFSICENVWKFQYGKKRDYSRGNETVSV